MHDLVQYLRHELNLALEGEVGMEIMLTEENLDLYEVQDAVNLPHPARVIGRGISFKEQSVTRIQVEPIEGEMSDGN